MSSFKRDERTTPAGDDFLCGPLFCSDNSREAIVYCHYDADEEKAPSVAVGILVVY